MVLKEARNLKEFIFLQYVKILKLVNLHSDSDVPSGATTIAGVVVVVACVVGAGVAAGVVAGVSSPHSPQVFLHSSGTLV